MGRVGGRSSVAPPICWTLPITTEQVQRLIREERDPRRAIAIFHSASAEPSYRHEPSTLSLLLSRLSTSPSLLLPLLPSLPPPIPEHPFPPLLRTLPPAASIRLFRRMLPDFRCPPTSPSYVAVLHVLVEGNHLKHAHRFYNEMKAAGFHDSLPARNVLLKVFCKSHRTIDSALKLFDEMPVRDSYTHGTLISGLCKLGMLEKAEEVFASLKDSSTPPDVISYTALLHGYFSSRKVDLAMKLFDEMRQRSVKPNVITYSTLIAGLCNERRAMEAVEMLEMMARNKCKPNMLTYSSVVSGLCREGRLKEAMEVVDRMRLQGCKPDAGLYQKLIVGLVDVGRCHDAANYLDEMIVGGVAPNRLTWGLHKKMHDVVVQGLCAAGGDIARAFNAYLCARSRSVGIEPETSSTLIVGLCRRGELDKATHVLEDMVREGCVPDASAWFASLHGMFQHGKNTWVTAMESSSRIMHQALDDDAGAFIH